MKKAMMFVLIIISSFYLLNSQDISVNIFLENFFETNNYIIENYTIASQKVLFAYRPKDNKPEIFDKGIMFIKEKNASIKPLVFFFESSLSNSFDLLFTGKIKTQKFFGWTINMVEKNGSFSTKFYTDDGVHVTEGPIFIWDNSKLRFMEYVVDKTMW